MLHASGAAAGVAVRRTGDAGAAGNGRACSQASDRGDAMKVVKEYPDGVFCWIDLSTTDIEEAKAFYGGLFGWEASVSPLPGGGDYTNFQIGGYNVAGGGELGPEMVAAGVPAVWNSYVKFDDVDGVVERARAAGGTVIVEPMDITDQGRMAMFTDPTGATLGIWSPQAHIGAQIVNQPNTLVWNELQTRDVPAAQAFFRDVFGWTNTVDGNGYVMYHADGRLHCGSLQMDETWGDMPPGWSVYFLVDDVDATAARAVELGGKVLVPPSPAGELGTMAVLQDPQGVSFSIIRFNGPADEPPGY
jgi:hypothetical protein